jgi:hypothetical protein
MFPIAPGHPNYSSSGTAKFIPEIWSGKLIANLYDATVLNAICNTDYEGEIKKFGDKVNIRTIPVTTIKAYVKGQKLEYDRPESAAIELLIDKGFYWGFVVDRIDKYQADVPLMDNWTKDASMRMKINTDTIVLQNIYNQAHASNQGLYAGAKSGNGSSFGYNMGVSGTPVPVTPTNILDCLVDMGSVLDEQNIPDDGRFAVLPPWMVGMIKKSDLKDASLTGDGSSILRNGRIGMIDRFTVYVSNLLHNASGNYDVIFGTKLATTFAAQITETETLKAESTFGDMVRGLLVYGYKVVKTEALGWFYCTRG